jgi:2-oxoglutarate ferredoxin oxidoreductase subunit alpha
MSATRSDLNVMVAGQGGDGSLTLVSLFADLLASRGYHLYLARNVGSRIKGGHAAGYLRASLARRRCLGDHFDLLVAFDTEALEQAAPHLYEASVVVYDCSDGQAATGLVPEGATLLEVPFGRLAVRDLRRDLYKNSLAFAVATAAVGVAAGDAEDALRRSLSRLPADLVEANVRAFCEGLAYANNVRAEPWLLADGAPGDHVLISGNEALAFGFLTAGGRFFAGYPITPASEILEWLVTRLPAFGGVAIQAEDELAAINMALGAAMTGTRAMTASSGPGIALMQEGIGHIGSAEIGVVVVDCQRAGPSTGMPTKPEQSDVGMLVHGANGDIPRIVLAPGDPTDAFELGVLATNLAERYQGPVYVALDQVISQDSTTVERFDVDGVEIDRGAMLTTEALAASVEYRRYALNGSGISPWAPAGTKGGQSLVTGNERDEWGKVTTRPDLRVAMMEKRMRKVDEVRDDLPRARRFGDLSADTLLIGFGMETGPMVEAAERLAEAGVSVQVLQQRTLWPVLEDVIEVAASCKRVYIVEHNLTAQYTRVLAEVGVHAESILRYDGVAFRPGELTAAVLEREMAWAQR